MQTIYLTLTREIAGKLNTGTILYHDTLKNKDGTPFHCRVNGIVGTWKRNPDKFKIPVKRGLYEFGYIENDTANRWSIKETY